MQVIATKKLYYGIIRDEGVEFTLTDPKHFDKRVMREVPRKAAAAKAADTDAVRAAEAEAILAAEAEAAAKAKADEAARKAEAERLTVENAEAAKDEKPAAPQPVARRRSTADQKR